MAGENKELNKRIIEMQCRAAAEGYGIVDVAGFVRAMVAVAGAESDWDELISHDAGHGYGLYGLHDEGKGAGMTVEARQDPYVNTIKAIEYLAPIYADAEAKGENWNTRLERMTGPEGQNPADPAALFRNALALADGADPEAPPPSPWMFGSENLPEAPAQGLLPPGTTPPPETYPGSGGRYLGEGFGFTAFTAGEERTIEDIARAIDVGTLSEAQAWKIIENYWSKEETQTRRAEEAGRRGSELLAGAHPGPYLPMTGPGGMGEALSKKYGTPNLLPGIRGIPGSQALGIFGQAQQQLGLPPQLSPTEAPQFPLPDWQALGQAMPTFGGTNYFEQLLKEGRMTVPPLR